MKSEVGISLNRPKKKRKWTSSDFQLLSMAMLSVIFLAVFAYLPMFGIILAFKDGDGILNVTNAIFKSPWYGLNNFKNFILDKDFLKVLSNTLRLNVVQLLINFPAPIIFALLINELRNSKFKRVIQGITYLPHFLSWVVFGGIVISFINVDTGVLNDILVALRIVEEAVDFRADPQYFTGLIVITSLLKGIGWGSIIYLAAISGIDPGLYEAATIDGANRFHKMIHVTIPSMFPTIILFFLLSISSLLNNGIEHILVFQTQLNLDASEVLDTFVLKYGITLNMYSYATAVGLFKSAISLILLLGSNYLLKKVTGEGIV